MFVYIYIYPFIFVGIWKRKWKRLFRIKCFRFLEAQVRVSGCAQPGSLKGVAAICSELAAEHFGLEVLDKGA